MKEEFIPLQVIKNNETHRFELSVDGYTAFIDFTQRGADVVKLIHTEVPEELTGRSVAAALVKKTLMYLEEHHFTLYPICPYVFAFIKKHPDWKRIVNENFKGFDA